MMKCRTYDGLRGAAWMTATLLAVGLLTAGMTACGGGSASSTTNNPPPPSITVALTPSAAQALDQGQTLSITATVSNDSSNKGVTWSVSGGGTLSNQTAAAVTYTAPASVTGATTATVTATSAASSSATAALTITVNPPPAVTTTTLTAATVGTAYSATLAATGGAGALSWALSQGTLPQGLSLSTAGVLAGTPTAAGKSSFSVTVTDAAKTTSAAAALTLTVNAAAPVALAITTTSLPSATAGSAYSTTLAATGGTTPYTWSLASGSTLPAGLALSAAGVISGSPTASGTSNFTVQVADAESPMVTKTQALALTVNAAGAASNDAEFKGQYAFLVADTSTGAEAALAASVTADGKGDITGGEYDLNGDVNAETKVPVAGGTYTVNADNRGTLTFSDAAGHSYTFAIALGNVTSGVATQGGMIETDRAYLMTGRILLQDATAFSLTALSGPFAFDLRGGPAQTFAEAGSFTAASGAISSGLLDANDNGTSAANQAFTGTLGAVDASGRGTAAITVGGTTSTLAFYTVSANMALLFGTNPTSAPAEFGEVDRQSGGPFSAASLSGNMVLVTQSATGVPSPHASIGIITADGVSAISGVLDTNDGGNIQLSQSFTGLTYAVTSAANGRFTLSGSGVHTQAGYLISPDNAFMVDIGGGPSNARLYAQSAGPFLESSLSGLFTESTEPMFAAPVAPPQGVSPYGIESGELSFDGVSALSGTVDEADAAGPSSSAVSDSYTVGSNGRVTVGDGSVVFYIIAPTHVVALLIIANDPNPVIYDAWK